MKQSFIKVENIKLLPETHDFFDVKISNAIKIFLYSILFLLTGLIVWTVLAKMDDVVKATAILRPIENISEMNCLYGGEILVKNYSQNQKVKKGDLLLATDCTAETNELSTLKKQIAKYEQELNDYQKLSLAIKDNIEYEMYISAQADSYFTEYKKLKLQVNELETKYDNEIKMPLSLRTQQKIDECKSQLDQAKLALLTWKNNKQINLEDTISSYEEKIQSINLRIATLERSIKNANLYAPIDGIIDEKISLNIGDYVIGGANILRIIPSENEKLKAEIVVDASKVARVKLNQEVKLRFPGLPPSSFGQLKGKINLIPADITVESNTPVFIVEADLPESFLMSSKGDKVSLRSGLSAEARIIISKDSVFKMILRKLDFIN